MKKVIVLTGPTGIGKTKISLELAKHFNLEIISADSVSIFKELNIGSAKIKDSEMEGIKHYLINERNLKDGYSCADFQHDFYKIEKNIDIPFLVGGSGLYISSAIYSYDFNGDIRNTLYSDKVGCLTNEQLYKEIIDIDEHNQVDKSNRLRLVRMHEKIVFKQIKSPDQAKPIYDYLIIYLDCDRDALRSKIEARLNNMIEQGLIDEVKNLKKESLYTNSIGYSEVFSYLEGSISYQDMLSQIVTHSMQLAKKQKTWFKNKLNSNFLDITNNTKEETINSCIKLISEFI